MNSLTSRSFRVQAEAVKANLNSSLEAAGRILIITIQMSTEAVRVTRVARGRMSECAAPQVPRVLMF